MKYANHFWVVLFSLSRFVVTTDGAIRMTRLAQNTATTAVNTTSTTIGGIDDIAVNPKNGSNIINGVQIPFGRYPYFSYPSNGVCGATLIWEDVLLSAAHCYFGFYYSGIEMYVGGTKADGSNAPETIPVRGLVKHVKHGETATRGKDVMLIFLQSPSTAPVSQWNKDPDVPFVGQPLTVIGHGETGKGGAFNLLGQTSKVVSSTTCAKAFDEPPAVFSREFVCMSAASRSACFGDSGGPLLDENDVIVGVVSFGSGSCLDPKNPNGFTRISTYSNWILERICLYSKNPPKNGDCDQFSKYAQCLLPDEQCLFWDTFPAYTIHKQGAFGDSCTEQCYPRSPFLPVKSGWNCGPCDPFNASPFDDDN